MDKIIKEILKDGGKCLIIEDGEPIGVILNMEEYDNRNIPKRLILAKLSGNKELIKKNIIS